MPDTRLDLVRCELDVPTRSLLVDGRAVPIARRPFEVLEHLVRNRHRVVTKLELLESIWPAGQRSPAALVQAMVKLRKSLDGAGAASAIRSVRRVGYQFVEPPAAPSHGEVPRDRLLTVALLPLRNETGDSALDWVEIGLAAVVAELLGREARLSLIAMPALLSVLAGAKGLPPQEQAEAAQRCTGAGRVVIGRILRCNGRLRVDYRMFGHTDDVETSLEADSPTQLATVLAAALRAALLDDGKAVAPGCADPVAAEAFARGLKAAAEQRWAAARSLFQLTLEFAPNDRAAKLELLRVSAELGAPQAELYELAARIQDEGAGEIGDVAHARAQLALGRFHMLRADYERAARHLRRAQQIADTLKSWDWSSQILLARASVDLHQCRLREAQQRVEEIRRLSRLTGNRQMLLSAEVLDGARALCANEYAQASQVSMKAAEQARRMSQSRSFCLACGNACEALAISGRLAEAAAWGADGLAAALAHGYSDLVESLTASLAWTRRLTGVRATGHALANLPEPPRTPDAPWRARGHLAAASADHAGAARCFEVAILWAREAGRVMHEQEALPWFIESLVLCGRSSDAEAELARCEARFGRGIQDIHVHVLLLRAMLAHRQGQLSSATELLQRVQGERPAPLWHTWALADAAWLQVEAGKPDDALRTLAGVDAACAELPLLLAVRARILIALGQAHTALALKQRFLEQRGSRDDADYFRSLEPFYAKCASGVLDPGRIPLAPALPSRL